MIKKIMLIIALVALSQMISQSTAQASEVPSDLPLSKTSYDFQDDPYLLLWSFALDKTTLPNEELTVENKILNRWKEKQAHLWKNLEVGKKFIVNASAYTAAADECGKNDGVTASGLKVEEKRTLACPPGYPFGAKISIDGVGTLRCEDRGGAIKGNHFDIYVKTKKEAFSFGRQHLEAEIVD